MYSINWLSSILSSLPCQNFPPFRRGPHSFWCWVKCLELPSSPAHFPSGTVREALKTLPPTVVPVQDQLRSRAFAGDSSPARPSSWDISSFRNEVAWRGENELTLCNRIPKQLQGPDGSFAEISERGKLNKGPHCPQTHTAYSQGIRVHALRNTHLGLPAVTGQTFQSETHQGPFISCSKAPNFFFKNKKSKTRLSVISHIYQATGALASQLRSHLVPFRLLTTPSDYSHTKYF